MKPTDQVLVRNHTRVFAARVEKYIIITKNKVSFIKNCHHKFFFRLIFDKKFTMCID